MADAAHDAAWRAARREFIRTHHPDVGGDAAEFLTGLARFDEQPPSMQPRVVVIRTQRWPARVVRGVLVRAARRRRPPRVH